MLAWWMTFEMYSCSCVVIPEKSARSGSNARGMPIRARTDERSDFVSILKRGSVRSTSAGWRAAVIWAKRAASRLRFEGGQVVGDDDGHGE